MVKYTIIAPVGDNMGALYIGLKEFPTLKVILLTPTKMMPEAKTALKELQKFGIDVAIEDIKGSVWEEMFKKIAEYAEFEKNILINTATGDRTTTCAATSAAFVNGIKAFSVENNEVMLLPVLKFSYYKILSERKMKILQTLMGARSFEQLYKKTKMSPPLLSYHLNGNLKSEGLVQMGLVDIQQEKRALRISLTMLGRLLVSGYVT